MALLNEERISCPYCGERLTILIDEQDAQQQYIEDCQVCCRPITIAIAVEHDGSYTVTARSENE